MTPILPNILPIVTEYGTKKAKLWLQGEEELAKPDDDLASFLARHDLEWDQLDGTDQDTIREVYTDAVAAEMHPMGSDSAASLLPLLVEAREALKDLIRDVGDIRGRSGEYLSDTIHSTLSKLQSIKA